MSRFNSPSVRSPLSRRAALFVSPLAILVAVPSLVFAQDEIPVAEAEAAPVAEASPEVAPAPADVAPAAPTAAVEAEVVAPAPTATAPLEPDLAALEAPEAEAAEEKKSINVGVWGRIDVTLGNPADSESLDDISSSARGELHLNGEVADGVGWTANLITGYGGGTISGTADIMDLIAEFGVHDSVNIWLGRMLVASDRSNFSGPWFMSAWEYPGQYVGGEAPVGPRQGPAGRNDGITVWGDIMDGHVKYYAGAYNLHDVGISPLLSGRLNISLINPEAGYYSNSTYYGGKDLLAIGLGFQTQKDGSAATAIVDDAGMEVTPANVDDYSLFNADILFEKNFGEKTGTLDLEAAFYSFSGDNEAVDTHLFGVASYLLPFAVGPGKLQPTFRLQQAKTASDETLQVVEGYLGYVVKEFALRGSLGFVNTTLGGAGPDGDDLTINAVKLGVQFMQ